LISIIQYISLSDRIEMGFVKKVKSPVRIRNPIFMEQ